MDMLTNVCNAVTRTKSIIGDIESTSLRRCLGTFHITLLGTGHMIGAGVYILTGSVVHHTAGPATIISYLIAGMAAFLSALGLAEFGAIIPKAGCSYTYVYIVIGEIWGFIVGWNLILENLLLCASTARAFSANLDALFDNRIRNATIQHIGTFGPYLSWVSDFPDFVALGYTVIIFIIIGFGVKSTVNVNTIFTLTNICIILFTSACCFYYTDIDNWINTNIKGGFFPYGASGVLSGAAVCFFAYTGCDAIAVASEEAKEPKKSIPLSIILSMSIVTTLYVLATAALTLAEPYSMVDVNSPFPSALSLHGLHWAKYIVAIGTLVGLTSTILGGAYALPRLVYAMANDGLLVRPFAFVFSKTKTPIWSILTFGIIAAAFAFLVELEVLAEFISIGTLLAFTMNSTALIIYRYSETPLTKIDMKITASTNFNTGALTEMKAILTKTEYDNELTSRKRPCCCNAYSHNTFIKLIVFAMISLLVCLAYTLLFGRSYIANMYIWPYIVIGLFLSALLGCFSILGRHRQMEIDLPFRVRII